MFSKRVSIFTGHFGSGKTEVAVNYALHLSKSYDKVAIVDFDIVNPYFRTADVKESLQGKGIWVITPMYANTNVDVPSLPPEINALFEKKEYRVVFDVGGDDLGAKVISRYRDEITQDSYKMFFVVNVRRPMTDTVVKIEEMIKDIEHSSGLNVDGLINNTNLLDDTYTEDIISSHNMIRRVSERLNKPVSFISGFKDNLNGVKHITGDEVLYMEKTIKLPWQSL